MKQISLLASWVLIASTAAFQGKIEAKGLGLNTRQIHHLMPRASKPGSNTSPGASSSNPSGTEPSAAASPRSNRLGLSLAGPTKIPFAGKTRGPASMTKPSNPPLIKTLHRIPAQGIRGDRARPPSSIPGNSAMRSRSPIPGSINTRSRSASPNGSTGSSGSSEQGGSPASSLLVSGGPHAFVSARGPAWVESGTGSKPSPEMRVGPGIEQVVFTPGENTYAMGRSEPGGHVVAGAIGRAVKGNAFNVKDGKTFLQSYGKHPKDDHNIEVKSGRVRELTVEGSGRHEEVAMTGSSVGHGQVVIANLSHTNPAAYGIKPMSS